MRRISFAVYVVFLTLAVTASMGQVTVVNSASFDPNSPIAPGSFASAFGSGLCSQTAAGGLTASNQYPMSLGGCSLTVNGVPAMMQFVSSGQVNFVMPQIAGSGVQNVVVTNGAGTVTGSMMSGPAGPGVFAMNGMGLGQGAMLHGTLWTAGPFSVTTSGQATPVAIFLTGLDLTAKPAVSIGGMPVEVAWFGNAPGYPGLQQINIYLPAGMAGSGRVPVTVTSGGQTSNVTYMTILPTTAMMQGMPGWGPGMMVAENAPRGREMSFLAVNSANNTALVTDENDDVVRVISIGSGSTLATITLPQGSQAHAVAVNAAGTLAAVPLSSKASVALIDLASNSVAVVIGTGYYPSRAAFSGANLLVTNSASGTVSVIDTNSRSLVQTVDAGFAPSGIAATDSLAVVADMQGASLALINLSDFTVTRVALPAGTRPHQVAISASLNKAVITTPMSNSVLVLDLATKALTSIDTGARNGMGPDGTAVLGSLAFVANQMASNVSVIDLAQAAVTRTISVDPGPRALAVNPQTNRLIVLAEGTGTLDVVDLGSYSVVARLNAGATERQGLWQLPWISSVTPSSAAAGTSFTLTITGSNLQGVTDVKFGLTGMMSGSTGGMMGGGMGPAMGGIDPNILVTGVQASSDGTRVTASVQIPSTAAAGIRQIRLYTSSGVVMGPMFSSSFTVTK